MQLMAAAFGVLMPDPQNFITVGTEAGESGLLKLRDDFLLHVGRDDFIWAETQHPGRILVFVFDGINERPNPLRVAPDSRTSNHGGTIVSFTA